MSIIKRKIMKMYVRFHVYKVIFLWAFQLAVLRKGEMYIKFNSKFSHPDKSSEDLYFAFKYLLSRPYQQKRIGRKTHLIMRIILRSIIFDGIFTSREDMWEEYMDMLKSTKLQLNRNFYHE